jgi:DNA-binding GntR family transcriptional regulator
MVSAAVAEPPASASHALGEQVYHAIENDIVIGLLRPGQKLDERQLAERFAVSRTPVREALNRLVSIGLVRTVLRQGAFVASLSTRELFETFDAMREMETLAARLAARRMTEDEGTELLRLAVASAGAAESGDGDAYATANFAVHRAIYHGMHNRVLTDAALGIHRRAEPYRRVALRIRGRLAISAGEHQLIAAAIVARDPETAAKLMHDHTDIHRAEFSDFLFRVSESGGSLP